MFLLQAAPEPAFPFGPLTLALLGVTIVAFIWAVASSRGRRAPRRAARKKTAPAGAARGAGADKEEMDILVTGAPHAPEAEVMTARGPNALAWATFGISAFGTLSSFVFSLLAFMRSG